MRLIEIAARIFLFVGIAILVGITALFLTKTTPIVVGNLDTTIWDHYGGVISGTVGTIFSLVGILFLIINLNEQRNNTARQQIETRFYQLLQIHRNNVAEMISKGKQGRAVFVQMKDEFHEVLSRLVVTLLPQPGDAALIKDEAEVNIAYLIWFFGVNNSSEEFLLRLVNGVVKDDIAYQKIKAFIEILKKEHVTVKIGNSDTQYGFPKEYLPFDGHQSRLSHYFRHLFQTVSYINEQPTNLISYSDKYNYVKTLRAQLSTYEQAIVFYNSLSELGKPWEIGDKMPINQQLITKYNLIKNLPEGFTQGIDPTHYYPNLFFEHQTEAKSSLRKAWEKQYT